MTTDQEPQKSDYSKVTFDTFFNAKKSPEQIWEHRESLRQN